MTSKWLWVLAIVLCIAVLLLGALVSEWQQSPTDDEQEPLTGRAYRIIGTVQNHKGITVNDSDALQSV